MQIKVLQVVSAIASGGISSVLLNYYEHIEREKVKFDFVATSQNLGINAEKLKALGSHIYILPKKAKNAKEYEKQLSKIIIDGEYDIVHVNQNYESFIPLCYAKKCNAPVRIAHAHTMQGKRLSTLGKILKMAGYVINPRVVTDYFACSKAAGCDVFGKKRFSTSRNAYVFKNAIDTEKFTFSSLHRDDIRKEMDWEDKLVVGHIGRLSFEKNQIFLINVFAELLKLHKDAVLCICGEGPEKEKIEARACELGIADNVQLLGNRSDVSAILNAFDVFVLPSLFEGIPVTGIEALTNGLPCVMSDTINAEFDEYNKAVFLSIKTPERLWAEKILRESKKGHDKSMAGFMRKAGYDIRYSAKLLEEFYINKVQNR